jgi:hypothetical protein
VPSYRIALKPRLAVDELPVVEGESPEAAVKAHAEAEGLAPGVYVALDVDAATEVVVETSVVYTATPKS